MPQNQKILAFLRSQLPTQWLQQNIAINIPKIEMKNIINNLTPIYKPRTQLENDPTHKQPIPYLIIINQQQQIACYPRQGNEKRLHGLYSIGIGGHVDQTDHAQTNKQTLQNALTREFYEELKVNNIQNPTFTFQGIINEEQTKVGHTHIGIVYTLKLPPNSQILPQTETAGMQWLSTTTLKNKKLEYWSQLAIKLIIPNP